MNSLVPPKEDATTKVKLLERELLLDADLMRCEKLGTEQYIFHRENFKSRLAELASLASQAPPFTDATYDIPLDTRLNVINFNHPRLGIRSTGKHCVPLTTVEAHWLRSLASQVSLDTPKTEATTHRFAEHGSRYDLRCVHCGCSARSEKSSKPCAARLSGDTRNG